MKKHTIPVFLSILFMSGYVMADTIAIIGTGRVASALGPDFAAQGHTIIYGSRTPGANKVKELVEKTGNGASAASNAEAAAAGDMVILAVPYSVVLDVVKDLGDLAGKIIIDPTNPYTGREGGNPVHIMNYQTSAAEQIQDLAPDAHVVKAFNTLMASTMADPDSSGGAVSIPVTADNEEAKKKVSELIASIGLHPVDIGGLQYSNVVEGMLVIWMNARLAGRPFDYYLRPSPE